MVSDQTRTMRGTHDRPVAARRQTGLPARAALAALVAAALLAAGATTHGQAGASTDEYSVKAAFLYNFAKFVDWPASAFDKPSAPLVLAVVGSDPFGSILDRTTQGERVNGRDIAVRRLKWDDDLAATHILYVSASEWRRLPHVFDRLRGASVLTVGDHDDFATTGGVIHFTRENYRVRFEINVRAAERAGLRISSKLLQLARIVGGPPEQPGTP
jgi:hypothetical protein